jgi:tetratricopeptide (TPR) repeat protein
VGRAAPTQPNLMSSYMNLAEAYMLSGERERALDCVDAARMWIQGQRSWRSNIGYLCESAAIALMMGNLALALQLLESVRSIARGRERAVPEPGAFEKLMIFETEHVDGGKDAIAMARKARAAFRDRHLVAYLEALAVTAWLEKKRFGAYTTQTQQELQLFERYGAHGLKASLSAQGFLE